MKKMADIEPHIIPSIYLANYLNDFEDVILNYEVQKTQIRKGSYLTQYGVINNTAYYIKNGIVHLSLGHEQGKKSLNMFGPGTIFPVGVEIHEFRVEYEMIIQALTDCEVYKMSYPTVAVRTCQHCGSVHCPDGALDSDPEKRRDLRYLPKTNRDT